MRPSSQKVILCHFSGSGCITFLDDRIAFAAIFQKSRTWFVEAAKRPVGIVMLKKLGLDARLGSFCVILVLGANNGRLDQAASAAWLGAKRRHKALRQELGGPGGGAAWFH